MRKAIRTTAALGCRCGRVALVLWRFAKSVTPKWLLPVLAACLAIPGPVDELLVIALVLVPVLRKREARAELGRQVRAAWNGGRS